MEQDHLPCAGEPPVLPPCDREVFERVWRRVMPEDRPDCPFLLRDREGDGAGPTCFSPPPAQTTAPAEPPAQSAALALRPSEEPCAAAVRPAAETPENDVPCLGAASAVHGAQLQAFIDHEIADWHTYQLLARRAQGSGGKVLSTLASDERRHAKRLSTAYFLISGVRYWPADRPAVPPAPTYLASLRLRFCAEQRGEAAYLAAAEETADAALRELYLELAGDENAHAWLLRGILEQL